MKRTAGRHEPGLSPGPSLGILLWALLLVAALPDRQLWPVVAAILAFALTVGRKGLQVLAKPRFWLVPLSILALSPFLLGQPDLHWGRIGLSREGLVAGFWMALRAVILMITFSSTLGALTVSQLIRLFDRIGLRGLGFALGVALNMLATLQDVVAAAYHTIRLRGGWRRPIPNAQLFLVTVIANALRYGDDILRAAHARAFDPSARATSREATSGMARGLEWLFLAGLVVSAAGLLLPWTW